MVGIQVVPEWMTELEEEEDVSFLKNFLLCSGSLKEIAELYGVTYPTVRLRLDRMIQKVKLGEEYAGDPYVALIKRLAINEKLDFDTAKLLITEYKKQKEEKIEMNVISVGVLLIPGLFLLGLIFGLVAFFFVRKRENKRRAQLHQAQRPKLLKNAPRKKSWKR